MRWLLLGSGSGLSEAVTEDVVVRVVVAAVVAAVGLQEALEVTGQEVILILQHLIC